MAGWAPGPSGLDAFNRLDDPEPGLLRCCASPEWAELMAGGRPYGEPGALRVAARSAAEALPWDEVLLALAAHPRIGERGDGVSRREQSGMDGASTAEREALRAANVEYERKFGHVYLIFASGKSAAEMLASARQRLDHDEATERRVVREQLGLIAALRLERWVADLA